MHYAVELIANNLRGKKADKIMLFLLFISFEFMSQYGGVPFHLNDIDLYTCLKPCTCTCKYNVVIYTYTKHNIHSKEYCMTIYNYYIPLPLPHPPAKPAGRVGVFCNCQKKIFKSKSK